MYNTDLITQEKNVLPVGFSVVVPSFNQGRFITATLESLLCQQYDNLEIIVIDGGSTDGTLEILRSYGDRIFWVSEPDKGQSDALRKGFSIAKNEWLTWLNSDDIQTNNALHCINRVIKANPDVKVVIGQGHYMDIEGNYLKPYPTILAGPSFDVKKELFEKGYVAQPSVFFHRSAYVNVGGINAELHFVMDYDLWVRMAVKDCKFISIKEDLSGNRWYETTKTASQLLPLYSEAIMVQIREFGRVSPYFVQAVSDHIYHILCSRRCNDRYQLLYRSLYFKSFWLLLNFHSPLYCLKGILTQSISKSGPIVGDKLSYLDCWKIFIHMLFKNISFFKQEK